MNARFVIAYALAGFSLLVTGCQAPQRTPPPAQPPASNLPAPSEEDSAFLDDLQRRIVQYFWNEVFPETGIAIDHTENRIGKVAATGFGLAALCIGVERGWIPREQAYDRTLLTLKTFRDKVDGQYGLWWHFVDGRTGKMSPVDCVALCDSADMIAGALVAGQYFKGTEVEEIANTLCDRVEWDQFVLKHPDGRPGLLSFGWVPLHVSESYYDVDGLLPFGMSGLVDNSLLIYVLALGSDTHPIPQETWEQYVGALTMDAYEGHECAMAGALFCRQVPHSFVRFNRKRDRKMDYFLDTVNAILADRAFNIKENGYPDTLWGLTDCFGLETYSHAAPPGPVANDGTIGCTAFAGALPHTPRLSMEAMRYVRGAFGDRAYGPYGFTSSVNPKNNFVSPRFVGIELGPMVQLIENHRSGLIWTLFSQSRVMSNFVRRAQMTGVVDDFELPPEAPAYAFWSAQGCGIETNAAARQNGHRGLAIQPASEPFTLSARLPANDLLDFHYNRCLAFWARDLEPLKCSVELNGKTVELEQENQLPGDGWTHYFYRLSPEAPSAAFSGISIEARTTGARPALDNLTCLAKVETSAPGPISTWTLEPGKLGGSVALQWTAPENSGAQPGRYRVRAIEAGAPEAAEIITYLPALQPSGGQEKQTLLLAAGKRYRISLAAISQEGHYGPESEPLEGESNPAELSKRAWPDGDASTEAWYNDNPTWTMGLDDADGQKALRVDYEKNHAWNYMALTLDPERAALHRYLILKMRGKVELLGKLWSREGVEQDMNVVRVPSDTEWTELAFDTWLAPNVVHGGEAIRRLILFPMPGAWAGKGTFRIAEVRYAN